MWNRHRLVIVALGWALVSVSALAAGQQTTLPAPSRGPSSVVNGVAVVDESTARPLTTGTAVVAGQVLESGSRQPVAGAVVTLGLTGVDPVRALADSTGRFVFRDLPDGTFTLTAIKPGYLSGAYGRVRPSGASQPLTVLPGARRTDLTIDLWRVGAIEGSVLDEHGEAVVGAVVRVLARTVVAGASRFAPAASDTTDDHGQYRVGGLDPGDYIVAVPMTAPSAPAAGDTAPLALDVLPFARTDDRGGPLRYRTTFAPAASAASDASIIPVGSGQERSGVDIRLNPVHDVEVSGTLTSPPGAAGRTTLSLLPVGANDVTVPLDPVRAAIRPDGTFVFSHVPSGLYTLQALKGGTVFIGPAAAGQPPALWAEVRVKVGDTDISNLMVELKPGVRLTGSLVFTGAAAKPDADRLATLTVFLVAADGATLPVALSSQIDASGGFAIAGIPPGSYIVQVAGTAGLAGWAVGGAIRQGRDHTDEPIEIRADDVADLAITLIDQSTTVSGAVVDATGTPARNVSVVAFPVDPSFWVGRGPSPKRMRRVRSTDQSRYLLGNLPAGAYFIAAVMDDALADWGDAKFLEVLSRVATRVDLKDKEKKTFDLRLVVPPPH